jgi:hypothetical protein
MSTTIDAKFTELPLGAVSTSAPEKPYDPFSLDAIRIDQSVLHTGAAKKLLTTVPVRKPNRQDFVRVHPGAEYRVQVGLLELKDDREVYLVYPNVLQELSESEYDPCTLYMCVNRQKVVSIWPVKLPKSDGKKNEWHMSAADAAERAMNTWIRMAANMSLGAYEISEAIADYGEPVWPELTFSQILKLAFKNHAIDRADHPVLLKLRGLE